jgi:hypothetical protein
MLHDEYTTTAQKKALTANPLLRGRTPKRASVHQRKEIERSPTALLSLVIAQKRAAEATRRILQIDHSAKRSRDAAVRKAKRESDSDSLRSTLSHISTGGARLNARIRLSAGSFSQFRVRHRTNTRARKIQQTTENIH